MKFATTTPQQKYQNKQKDEVKPKKQNKDSWIIELVTAALGMKITDEEESLDQSANDLVREIKFLQSQTTNETEEGVFFKIKCKKGILEALASRVSRFDAEYALYFTQP